MYSYSTNIGTEYFKHGTYSPFFFSSKCSLFHNSNVFGPCIIHILYTGVLKLKKNNSGPKRLICAAGDLAMSNHVYTARLFELERSSPMVSTKIPCVYLFIHLFIYRLGFKVGLCQSIALRRVLHYEYFTVLMHFRN